MAHFRHWRLGEGWFRPRVALSLAVLAAIATAFPLPSTLAGDAFGRKFFLWPQKLARSLSAERSPAAFDCAEACPPLLRAAHDAQVPPEKRNVVLVVVESFGAITSKRWSGAFDLVPRFHAWSEKGTTFTRYWSTGANSWSAFFALVGGMPPLPLLRHGDERFEWWTRTGAFPGPARALAAAGYETMLLSGYRWLNEEVLRFASAAGFANVE